MHNIIKETGLCGLKIGSAVLLWENEQMKTIRLSSNFEKRSAALLAALIILALVFVLTRGGMSVGGILVMILCCGLCLTLVVGYLVVLIRAAIRIDGEDKLTVCGLGSYSENIGASVAVKTVEVSIGAVKSRAILLLDDNQDKLSMINTFFTAREGVMAEPAAKELAAALGLKFIASLEPWRYDKQEKKRYEQEARLKKKEKRQHRKSGAAQLNEKEPEINYDMLDDER